MINKKILITGGAGFIGSHLSKKLLSKGYNIIIIDNFNEFYNPEIKEENFKSIKEVAKKYCCDLLSN